MKRLLVVAEGATLAHVGRPLALARAAMAGFEVVLALPASYRWAIGTLPVATLDLDAQSPAEFARRLARGDPLYDLATLERYVADDLALLESVQPDCVIGDFRLSLSVSARLAGVRYCTLGNAYWSPFYVAGESWPVPDLPLTRILPVPVARWLFNRVRPMAFRSHARAMGDLRRNHGLPDLGGSLTRAYTDADATFYTDIPSVFQLRGAPATQRVVGPLPWAPPVGQPVWWNDLPPDRPIAYVSMGSSGRQALAEPIALALVSAGFRVLVTADPKAYADNPLIHAARFMPGDLACGRASVVICNGGSPTSQQALAAGKPVIGIASNLDQFLNMDALEHAGLGALLRADRFSAEHVVSGALRALDDLAWQGRVSAVKKEIEVLDASRDILSEVA
jgi:UDP:flavonoid glycosyltransferase YjiC (YdhE family)